MLVNRLWLFSARSVLLLTTLAASQLVGITSANDCSVVESVHEVDENTKIGTVIFSFSAFNFTITTAQDLFSVVENPPGNWSVKVHNELNAEELYKTNGNGLFTYSVTCVQSATQSTTQAPSNINMIIVINDVDEFVPDFPHKMYTINVSESTPLNADLFTFDMDGVRAVDADARPPNPPDYRIVDGDLGYFAMNDILKGVVTLAKQLDYESGLIEFNLNVSVKESSGDANAGRNYCVLQINVVDVDDMNPIFDQSSYRLQLNESMYSPAQYFPTVPPVSAHDGDLTINTTILFTVDTSSRNIYGSKFILNQTGYIAVNGSLELGLYSINIKAYQQDNPISRFAVAVLTLNVTGVNKFKPEMSRSQYQLNVSELAPVGLILLTVAATDKDSGDNAVFEFFLDNNVDGTFRITTDQGQGIITLVKPLDRETKASYSLQVYAKETKTAEKFKSNISSISITVLDENDNSPNFTQQSYLFTINRTSAIGTLLGMIKATDPDEGPNGQVLYSLQPSTDFSINSPSGQISLKKILSTSDVGTKYVTAIATDNSAIVQNRRSTFVEITINILPVNDQAPVFSATYTFNISETTPPNTVIGQLKANDPDGDIVMYFIQSGNSDSFFQLGQSNGVLSLIKENDLDVASPKLMVKLVVVATDGFHNTSTDVNVNFLYVNEFDPVIQPIQRVQLNETAVKNTLIVKVEATDKDRGADGVLTYSLVPASNFSINPATGEITLACDHCLDYNTKQSYDLFVLVEDGGNPHKFSFTTFTVAIKEIILASPKFSQKNYEASIKENQNTTTILQLKATDPDTPDNLLSYIQAYPLPAAALSCFVSPNGTVECNTLDAEMNDIIVFDVNVTDGSNIDTATITIHVLDVNDNSPKIGSTSPIDLSENTAVGQLVYTVTATDLDRSNEGFTFFLIDGTDGKFIIDRSTGAVTTAGVFDRSEKQTYNVNVWVSDHGTPPRYNSTTLVVNIIDSNTPPEFVDAQNQTTSEFVFEVNENLTIGSLVGSIHARDPDSGSSGRLSFSIQGGDPDTKFVLGSSDGNLVLAKSLNYESQQTYTLTAVVADHSFSAQSATARVTVNVKNVIEAPQWPLPFPVVYLTQSTTCNFNLQAFSREVTTVATKGDEPVEYKLLNMTSYFTINKTSGLLRITRPLNASQYSIALAACSGDVCSNADLTVVVQTDDILVFCPAFVNVWINESSPIGYTVTDLNTNKGDNDVQYKITSGNEDDSFYIESKNGTLFVWHKLDRETVETYSLLIEAVKASSQETATVQVNIGLTDAPDTPPMFLSTKYEGEIGEDAKPGDPVHLIRTSIDLTVNATDKDLQASLSYSISNQNDTSAGAFSVNELGVIGLNKPIDYESMAKELNGIYSFSVVVTDGIFNTSVTVVVHVLDANDNSPTFDDPGLLWLNVSEDSGQREIGRVSATDRDSLDAGKLDYTLEVLSPLSKGNPFSINTKTGQINLEDSLDRERVDEYLLRVTVVDSAHHNATKEIKVTVLDVNDQAPTFPLQNYYWNITEGVSGNGSNLKITAYDKDVGKNAVLLYSLSGDKEDTFTLINTSNNEYVQTVKPLDRETLLSNGVAQIQLTVEASDNLSTSTCTIFVTVMDINDNPPVFSQSLFIGQVKENATNTTEIHLSPAITVSDADGPEYGRETVRFTLADNSSFFYIDPTTGNLFVRCLAVQDCLDRETKSVYNLMVIAADDYGKGLSANASIVINISDVNDEKPVFKNSSYIFYVPEDAKIGYSVGELDATDNDIIGGITLYSLVGSDMFAIDSITGVIKVTGHLEGKISLLTLNAAATDGVNGFSYAEVSINITDVNDHCPEWDPASLTFSVSETGQVGDFIGQLNASDADFGANGAVSYHINNTDANMWLNISQTGNITLLKAPSGVAYDLNVYATDGGVRPCVTPAKLHINVIGVNKYPPEICYNDTCGVQYAKFDPIPDKSKVGSVIGQIFARDNDTGINGKVTFNLAGSGSDFLNVSDLGFLILKKDIDVQKMTLNQVLSGNTLKVTILAVDGGTDHKTANATLEIPIMGTAVVNFRNSSYTFDVDENKNNTFVGRVEVTSDLSNQISYTIITKDIPFKINGSDGTITTTSALDREVMESVGFIVSASAVRGSSSVLVIVKITDENEYAPVFDDNSITVSVQEGLTKPNLATVHAHDDDATDNFVTYELLDSEAFPQFNVSKITGSINLVKPLDAENKTKYTIQIVAKDAGTPERNATATVTIEVLDVNEYPPEFEKLFYEFNVTQSDRIPQELATVKATDKDASNDVVLYTLIQDGNNNDSKSFSIDIFTGVITVVQTLDKKDVYSFQVKATDFGGPLQLASNVTVKINVLKTDIKPQLSVSPTTVTTFVGMVKGSALNVIISTQDAITLNITDGDTKNVFKIEGEKIILQTQLTDVAVYTLTVTATSASGSKTTQQLTVTVTSVSFDQPFYYAKLPENSGFPQVICTVNSLAANLSVPVKYTLQNYNDKFKIDSNGAISVEKSLDREEQALYLLYVTIQLQLSSMNRKKRQVNQQATNQTTVVVWVEDKNDNPPSFGNSGSVLSLDISANVGKSYLVATLKAFDPDEGLNGVINYQIVRSDVQGVLTLNSTTGDLIVASSDLLKLQSEINLNVSATDKNGSGSSAFLPVKIKVKSETIYKLKAAIPRSTFNSNQVSILGNLSHILGFEVKLSSVDVTKNEVGSSDILLYAIDEKNATVPADQIEKKVNDKQSEITALFESFSKSSKGSRESDGDFSVSAIALIVLACVMFFISLGAILVAYLLWRKQRNYSEKEENAAKVRQKIDEQMGNIKTESLSSDPDEHLEMVEMTPENVDEQEVTLQFETEFKSSISTMALRRHLQDKEMQWRQQLFQAIGEEDEERQRTASLDSDSGPSSPVNDQAAAYVNGQLVAHFNDQVAAYVNDQVLAPVLSHLNRDTGVIYEEVEDKRDDGSSSSSSSSSSSVFVAGTDVSSPEGAKFNDLDGLYELVGKTGKDVHLSGTKPRDSSSSSGSDVSAKQNPTEIYKSPRNGSPTTNNSSSLNTDMYSLPLNLNSKIKSDARSLIKPASQVNGGLGFDNVDFQHEDNEEPEEEEFTHF